MAHDSDGGRDLPKKGTELDYKPHETAHGLLRDLPGTKEREETTRAFLYVNELCRGCGNAEACADLANVPLETLVKTGHARVADKMSRRPSIRISPDKLGTEAVKYALGVHNEAKSTLADLQQECNSNPDFPGFTDGTSGDVAGHFCGINDEFFPAQPAQ